MGCHDGQRFRAGQRVRLAQSPDPNDARWPADLVGVPGTVDKPNSVTVWVQFDADGPFNGRRLKVAASALAEEA
jgi:hypothetical protein